MLKTKITEMLGIERPILVGGLQWLCTPEFVAAIAEAGGAAFLMAGAYADTRSFAADIRKCKALTKKPFGVNISMLPEIPAELTVENVEAVIAEGLPFVETSGRDPAPLVDKLKPAGVKVLHKVTAPQHAKSAERAGVDAVIIVGYESAGHPGMNQVGTFVNLPAAAEEVSVPVIAAGGICDGKSMAAALSLGAEGVMIGTRAVATEECPVHQNFKDWIVNAGITDTIIIQRSLRNAARAIKNDVALTILGLEQTDIKMKDVMPYTDMIRSRDAMMSGDMNNAMLTAGQCVGRIHAVQPVGEVLREMTEEAETCIKALSSKII